MRGKNAHNGEDKEREPGMPCDVVVQRLPHFEDVIVSTDHRQIECGVCAASLLQCHQHCNDISWGTRIGRSLDGGAHDWDQRAQEPPHGGYITGDEDC